CNVMMNDREISRGCKQGNAIAQRALFDKYSPELMAVIFRYVGDDDDAQDVLQDTFISAYSNIERFKWEGEGSLRAWLNRIAVNKSLNFLRMAKRLSASQMPVEAIGDPPDDNDEDTTTAVNGLDAATILEMVSQLPDGYRTVFNLYCLDGYSHQQIAKQLGISEKTSSSQLARAKALLARKIKTFINEHNIE
ncbi:MAG: RNA polymerase sigma factor, partial [Muribaculaceae bacterium]|nr:RNA polymerase sigma factor [Muribaculaceae bacterium]